MATSLGIGGQIVTDGLTHYLDAFNKNSYESGTVWNSLVANDTYYQNLYNSPTLDTNNLGISFDGVDQYALRTINLGTNLDNEFTVEIWFKMNTLPTAQYAANSHVYGGQLGNNNVIFIYPAVSGFSKVGVCYDDSRYNSNHESTKSIEAGEWIQFVWMNKEYFLDPYQVGQLRYHINGQLDRDWFTSSDTNGSSDPVNWYIARDTRWAAYSDLTVGMIKHYSRLLTDEEILNNYNATKSRFGL